MREYIHLEKIPERAGFVPPSYDSNQENQSFGESFDGDKDKFDPSKLNKKTEPHIVQINNNDEYTRMWSIKAPDQVAAAMKQLYKSKFEKELLIDTKSLSLEIFIHAFLSYQGILPIHTDKAECGEYFYDSNRFFWDALHYNIEYGGIIYP